LVRSAQANQGAMGEEMRRVVQDMRVGVSRATALTHMADRVDIPELRGFVAALSQADQLGVPVTETLRVQAEEMRLKQRQAAEEMAMKLPVKILFPTVLCILPVIFIVLLGPAALRIFDQFTG
jgi:tight adherence protein C